MSDYKIYFIRYNACWEYKKSYYGQFARSLFVIGQNSDEARTNLEKRKGELENKIAEYEGQCGHVIPEPKIYSLSVIGIEEVKVPGFRIKLESES